MKCIAVLLVFASFAAVTLTNGVTYCAGADGFAGYAMAGCRCDDHDAGHEEEDHDSLPSCHDAPECHGCVHALVPLQAGVAIHSHVDLDLPVVSFAIQTHRWTTEVLPPPVFLANASPPLDVPLRV